MTLLYEYDARKFSRLALFNLIIHEIRNWIISRICRTLSLPKGMGSVETK